MYIRKDIRKGENLPDPRADHGLLFTSVFVLPAIDIENFRDLH